VITILTLQMIDIILELIMWYPIILLTVVIMDANKIFNIDVVISYLVGYGIFFILLGLFVLFAILMKIIIFGE